MPSDALLKTMNAVHRVTIKVTGGRVGWGNDKTPTVELTTTGRRTGRRHTVMLASPLQEGSTIVLVASRGGDDHHPAWFLNLRDHADVEASFRGGPMRPMKARVATPEERERLWPLVIADHNNYAVYQGKTSREIPVVLLDPQ